MTKKVILPLSILIIFTGSFFSFNHLISQASIVIVFFLLILFLIFKGSKERKGISVIKNTPFYTNAQLTDVSDQTLVKIKGKLRAIKFTMSEMTETRCIGYQYQEMKWTYKIKKGLRREGKERRKRSQWKIIKSESHAEDFYIYDKSGKIMVDALGLSISSNYNQKKMKRGSVSCIENLLLPDQKEYILIGTLHKENGKNSIVNDFKHKDNFILIDPKSYDIIYNTSKAFRIGCAIFLILILTTFMVIMTMDLWEYLIERFL